MLALIVPVTLSDAGLNSPAITRLPPTQTFELKSPVVPAKVPPVNVLAVTPETLTLVAAPALTICPTEFTSILVAGP